jgi:polyhydroxybutyrate depolymerase
MTKSICVAFGLLALTSCFRVAKEEPERLDSGVPHLPDSGVQSADAGVVASEQKIVKLMVDSIERSFIVYQPNGRIAGTKLPLIFALHGGKGTADDMFQLADFRAIADREQIVLIYPDGIEKSWNDGRPTAANQMGIDDVNFFRQISNYAIQNFHVDPRRIFATGMSNGGFMSARLGCELSDVITGIATVASSISQVVFDNCQPRKPVAAMVIQGSRDTFVPLDGGLVSPGAGGLAVSHDQAVQKWVAVNKISSPAVVVNLPDIANDGTTIAESTHSGGTDGFAVVGYVVLNGGHTWPQGGQYLSEFLIGKTSQDMNANEVIWAFFKRFQK